MSSAPLGEIVERTLEVSDNQAAEVLARHVGLAERQEGSFEAGAAAVLDVLRGSAYRVAGDQLYDGSGLSRRNRLSAGHPRRRAPARREPPTSRGCGRCSPACRWRASPARWQYRFDTGPTEARGRVRAKTGTLTGVHGLAGVADDVSGGRMAFVVVADAGRAAQGAAGRRC